MKSKAFRWGMLIIGAAVVVAVSLFAARFAILTAIYPELFAYAATSPDGLYADGRGTEDGVVYTYVSAKAGEDGTSPSLHCMAGDLSISLGELISPDAIRASGGLSVAGPNGETEWRLVSATGQSLRVTTDREDGCAINRRHGGGRCAH